MPQTAFPMQNHQRDERMIRMPNKLIPDITLSNGVSMPAMGFGVAGLGTGPQFYTAMESALENGYRFFDTAPFYENEGEVGQVLRTCGVPREELFIATKLPNACHAYEDTLKAFDAALKNMGLDYLDLYMIHFPMPMLGLYQEAWRAMEKLYHEGLIRAIGVSNFQEHHLQKIFETCEIKPHTNELECNPYLTVRPLCNFCRDNGIRVINWFPLGGPREPLVPYPMEHFKVLLEDPVLREIGENHGKSTAQIALRWAVQNGIVPIPKSENPVWVRQNREIFDFSLTDEELARIDALDHDRRLGPDPNTFDDMEMG